MPRSSGTPASALVRCWRELAAATGTSMHWHLCPHHVHCNQAWTDGAARSVKLLIVVLQAGTWWLAACAGKFSFVGSCLPSCRRTSCPPRSRALCVSAKVSELHVAQARASTSHTSYHKEGCRESCGTGVWWIRAKPNSCLVSDCRASAPMMMPQPRPWLMMAAGAAPPKKYGWLLY